MKKALFAALCCLLAVSACKKDEQEVHVTGVSVSPATLSLVEGTSDQLRATVTPSDAANKSVSWTSSATAIATVDNTGKVTAVSAGTATITVKTADGGKTATCAVTVTTKVIPVTGISIEEGATAEVEEGKTVTLTAKVQPDNATDKTVTWTSSNKAIATVADGVVTGVAAGQAVITAKAGDKEATCTVTVKRPEPVDGKSMKEVTADDLGKLIGLDGKVYPSILSAVASGTVASAVIVYVGSETAEGSFTHGLAMSMRDAVSSSGYTFNWKTSSGNYDNPQYSSDLHSLLEYKESGYSLTKGRGESPWEAFAAAKNNTIHDRYGITAAAPEGTSGWFLPSIFQWQQAIHAMTGKTKELSLYDANPDYVNDKVNAKIVDPEAFLTKNCYASSSEFDATYNWHFDFQDGIARRNAKWCDYYVRAFLAFYGEIVHPSAVKLNKTEATRYAGGLVDLKAKVIPAGATNKDVTWTSSNETVAKVDANGRVTVLAEGETTITVTTVDGGLEDKCKLTVDPIPSGAVFTATDFNNSTADEPLLILQQDWSSSTVYFRRASGTVDLNGHTIKYVYMQNNDPDKVIGLRNGIISHRLDGDAGWYRYTGQTFYGKVLLEDMEVYKEFYTDGHIYTINSGYYETVCTFRVGTALGDVYIYGGSFGKLFDNNPDAGSNQGDIYLYGGKFAIDPRTYTNAGTPNPGGHTKFIVPEGYSVKDNTGEDKDEFPYIVSKD
ncbi:MAG: Ig-like domain-containing protein [Bacteroidales bacterium]|nr:Ig-like domain-containing protein [Bacteroidales bacterium]